ncbi:starch synthase catalytic domain-containing protein [Chlamydoabsidia padenii]|nr:starch synthase catalytic domain-containing protein [Chlamydoabsidia padenii]
MPQAYNIPSISQSTVLPSLTYSLYGNGPVPTEKRQLFLFPKYDKKWRWWHYLSVAILFVGVLESFALSFGYRFIQGQSSGLRILVRQYPSLSYQHFDTLISSSTAPLLQQGITVYHVSNEFGPATMGSIGSVVTSLATAQQRSGQTKVAVVMPYYSFLKNKYDIDKVVDLVIDIHDKHGKLIPIEFRVWKMIHLLNPPVIDNNNNNNNTQSESRVIAPLEQIPVYLIGPGNRKPFNQAFRCRTPRQIYSSSPSGLPHEWRDQYFAKAASHFLVHRATATDEESLFAPLLRLSPSIDVVHLHGATNAYIAKYLDDKRKNNQLGATPPSIVYTMHNHLDEWQYTNTVGTVKKFLDAAQHEDVNHVYGNKMFMSRLGIDRADVVTFVSRTMATAMVEGTLDFYLKELVMDQLLRKAKQNRFFGISNGLDLSTINNPFTTDKLVARRLNYPDYAQQLLNHHHQQQQHVSDHKHVWQLSAYSSDFVATAKDKAKRFLVRRHLLPDAGAKRPLMLYISEYNNNKGLEWVEQAAQLSVDHNMTFILLLRPEQTEHFNNLESLQSKHPDHIHLLSTSKQHRQWSLFCRAAADFVLVLPDPLASTSLQAASESLLFGTSIISTRVGDLQEILIDRPTTTTHRDIRMVRDKKTHIPTVTSGESYNAYLFNSDKDGLSRAIGDAMVDYKQLLASKALREEYNLRMISSALALGWDRQGLMDEYRHVYALALHQRLLPEFTEHEVEEEQILLRQLDQTPL